MALVGVMALILIMGARGSMASGRAKVAESLAHQISGTLMAWALDVRPSQTDAESFWGTSCLYRGTRSVTSPVSGATYQVHVPPWIEECRLRFRGTPVDSVTVEVVYGGRTYQSVQ